MLQTLIQRRLVTPPAIWGKLPSHADFVRSGMRHGESESWQTWLTQQDCLDRVTRGGDKAMAAPSSVLPTAFVMPPRSLSFAPHRFAIGVLAPSVDKVGRPHVLLVYQLAHLRWLRLQFDDPVSALHEWLFWLARTVARHTYASGRVGEPPDVQTIVRAVHRLWQVYAPGMGQLWGRRDVPAAGHKNRQTAVRQLLDQWCGPPPADDMVVQLHGVSCLPWADWPQRLYRRPGNSNFWQQDAEGGFVNAATRLPALWGEA